MSHTILSDIGHTYNEAGEPISRRSSHQYAQEHGWNFEVWMSPDDYEKLHKHFKSGVEIEKFLFDKLQEKINGDT